MAYDAVRAQLDKLLGPDRNGPLSDAAAQTTPHYTDDSICKSYLLGFCPNDLHIKHRSEPGSCRLTHSDIAKTHFQKDDHDGNASRDKLRWTRALLKDCRLILAEEDRKIRGHAKRLQVSYNAPGNLAGLMIRDFDTLKKLGMVSKDAEIKVQIDDEHEDDFTDFDLVSKNETQPNQKTVTNSSSLSVDARSNSTTVANDIDLKKDRADADDGDADDDGDDDDDDGFDIVKVIPADSKENDDQIKESGPIKANQQEPSALNNDAEEDDDSDFEICSPHSDTHTDRDLDSTDDKSNPVPTRSGSPKAMADQLTDNISSDEKGHDANGVNKEASHLQGATNGGTSESKSGKDIGSSKSTDTGADPNVNNTDTDLTAEQIMNKFYETGKGPDGLMMLDRKQSLRVCACCGGFISLVDAESRLLSHYGGKSHHSLATLREKVSELEKTVVDLSSRRDEAERGLNPRREPNWQRDVDRNNSPGWMRRDKDYYQNRRGGGGYSNGGRPGDYNAPPSYDRGYTDRGFSDRVYSDRGYSDRGYSRSGYSRSNGYDRRRDNHDRDHGNSHDSRRGDHYGRYNDGRKRHRSPSPHRSNRRSRRH